MAKDRAPGAPASGWWFILAGVLLGAVGGLFLTVDDGTGVAVVLLGAGSTFATIGAVAVGVTVGLLRADWVRRSV